MLKQWGSLLARTRFSVLGGIYSLTTWQNLLVNNHLHSYLSPCFLGYWGNIIRLGHQSERLHCLFCNRMPVLALGKDFLPDLPDIWVSGAPIITALLYAVACYFCFWLGFLCVSGKTSDLVLVRCNALTLNKDANKSNLWLRLCSLVLSFPETLFVLWHFLDMFLLQFKNNINIFPPLFLSTCSFLG